MTERPDELERILTDLATRVDFPATPNLAASVHVAIATTRGDIGRPWRHAPRWIAVAVAVVLIALIATAVNPRTRHAVADWLGLPGIHIIIEHERSSATPAPAGVSAPALLFGQQVRLTDVTRVAGFPVRVPAGPPLGTPASAYVRQVGAGTMVSFVYRPTDDLPAVGSTGVGAYLMEMHTGQDYVWMIKTVPSGNIQHIEINGQEAFWLTDAQVYFNPDPSLLPGQDVPARESGNVLIWAQDGVTYRLETKLDQDQAVAIAASLLETPGLSASPAANAVDAPLFGADGQQPAGPTAVAAIDVDRAVDDQR